jgi:hypothetical protein
MNAVTHGPADPATAHRAATADWPRLLRSTRRITIVATVFLLFQLYGNLYEEILTNVKAIAQPTSGALVGALSPGSPMFLYQPWAPLGVVLVIVLAMRLRRIAPAWVARRAFMACGALFVAVAAKVYLIGWVNPVARDATVAPSTVRADAIQWGVVNGIAILAVATALVLVTSWRIRAADADHTDHAAIRPAADSVTAPA